MNYVYEGTGNSLFQRAADIALVKTSLASDAAYNYIAISMKIKRKKELLTVTGGVLTVSSHLQHSSGVAVFSERRRSFVYGQVSQGFAEVLDEILEDYMMLLCSLESQLRAGHLNLISFWLRIEPLANEMALIAELCREIAQVPLLCCTVS